MRSVTLSILVLAASLSGPIAYATSIPIGFVSFDVTAPGVAQFDINNETGPNSSGDPTFPVTTTVSLSDLSLDIQYASGPDVIFGPSSGYFSLAADGISWDGTALSTSANQSSGGLLGSVDAILTGTFDTTSLTLYDGTTVTIDSTFSARIVDPSGLTDGDLALIYATTVSAAAVPEPSSMILMFPVLLSAGLARKRIAQALSKSDQG